MGGVPSRTYAAPKGAGAYPSLLRRLAGMLYESLLIAAIAIAGGFVFVGVAALAGDPSPDANRVLPRTLLQGFLLALVGGYFVLSWSRGGQTLAMRAWRLRLVLPDGAPVPAARAGGRFLLAAALLGPAVAAAAYLWRHPGAPLALLALGPALADLAWALVDRERQFLHDRLAGTRLIVVPPTTASPAP